jgi:hypothetical protein
MTPPLKTEGVPGRCRARYSMTEPYWMRAAIDGINAFQLLLAATTPFLPLPIRHPIYSGGVLMILAPRRWPWARSGPSCALCGFAASSRRGSSTRSGFSRGSCQYKAACRIRGWLAPLTSWVSCVHVRRV